MKKTQSNSFTQLPVLHYSWIEKYFVPYFAEQRVEHIAHTVVAGVDGYILPQ